MNASDCTAPIGFSALIEYWLDELDEAAEARIDEHLLSCQECSEELAEIIALAGGIRAAFAQGAMRAFVTDAFVKRLAEQGVRLREYRVPRNGSVNCSVAPEDEVLVARLEAPLAGVTRVDAISYLAEAPPEVFRDILFDPASGEVVITPKIAQIRAMPPHRYRIELVAVDAKGERVIGEYTFNHTPSSPSK
jgi:hypothetical protein